jgi:hypothetical protein
LPRVPGQAVGDRIVAASAAGINARPGPWRKPTMTPGTGRPGMRRPAARVLPTHSRGMAMGRSNQRPRRSRRFGAVAATALASASVLFAPGASLAQTPVDGGTFTILPVPIDTGPGDQFDAHVSGDLVSYTSDFSVRFYDFFSGDGGVVPAGSGVDDYLSDVDAGRIVFSRDGRTGGTKVFLYDVASGASMDLDPSTARLSFEASIGGSSVAFIDSVGQGGDLFVSTIGGSTQRLTSDTRAEYSTAISPAGDVVVYDSCDQGCEVRQATRVGATWSVSTLAVGSDLFIHNPDTDGTTVVYDDVRGGDRDIYWQPVGGGVEGHLQLPGDQVDAAISGGLMFFRSIAVGDNHADLFVYQISTNRLFRITTTPDDDDLTDITVLPNGNAHIVWSSGDFPERDVFGATIQLPAAGPTYHFGGFQQPVDPRPILNQMKAGAAVPVKFSLGGNQGLSIFAAGYPKSQVVACDASADVDGIETTLSAGGSSLAYDPATDTYSYVWKTDKSWAGTCRQLVLAFADGSIQRATFKFK